MKKLIQSILSRFGLQLVRSETVLSYSLSSYFALLKEIGFAPNHVLDVGANRGKWTREAIRFFPNAHYTLVEPQDHLKANVQSLIDAGKVSWVNAGAGNELGELPFAMSDRDDSSSFVVADPKSKQIMVTVRTLNEIVSSSGAPFPDMVKIDTEGFELKVLDGASDLFGKTDIFLLEAILHGDRENTVLEVIERMAAVGYQIMDITDLNRSPKSGLLWLIEIAFLRTNSQLLERVSFY